MVVADNPGNADWPKFADTDEEARDRAIICESDDPLRSIPCGLLSSAEIDDYVRNTGMIFPYDRKALKSASYEMHLGGQFIHWDEHWQKRVEVIDRKKTRYVILPANSITFVQVEPYFRLPNYIAIRFNLRITHVHRGLLLGTGPLVDPGFHGKLLIPLHNLTAFEYYLDTDKALIWVEFTKTTFGFWPGEAVASKERHFVPFPREKRDLSPDEYLFKARGGQPIVSSIPHAIESAQKAARDATEAVRRQKNGCKESGLSLYWVLFWDCVRSFTAPGVSSRTGTHWRLPRHQSPKIRASRARSSILPPRISRDWSWR
jgi:deoxycytidine triphosphate deaminase